MPDKQEQPKQGAKDIKALVEECLANNFKYQKNVYDIMFEEPMDCCTILDESKGCPYISNDAAEDPENNIYLACAGIKKKEES